MDPRYSDSAGRPGMSEHRVSVLGSPLRRSADPETSRDPRVRSVVHALKTLDYAPAPAAEFRAELRAQLVAIAPRIIAENEPAVGAPVSGRATRRAEGAQRASRRFGRPIAIAAGVAAAFIMLFGGALWMSQKALPGDSLYGLKRASEDVQLSLTSGNTDRGHRYLSYAQIRVEEARALLRRDSASASGAGILAGGLSPQTAKLIADNLASADGDLRSGTKLLNTQAVDADSRAPISIITGWAPGQLDRLHDLATALPKGSLQNRTVSSWTLTNSALTRARTLSPTLSAPSAPSLPPAVPLPSRTPAPVETPKVGPTVTSGPHSGGSTSGGAGSSGTGSSGGTGRTGGAGSGGRAPTPSGGVSRTKAAAPVIPSLHPSVSLPDLPTLPLSGQSPLGAASCGVSVSVGSVTIGGCPSHS